MFYNPSGLRQQKFIPSNFWRLEIQDQGVTGLLKTLGENLFHAFLSASGVISNPWHSLAYSCVTPIFACIYTAFSSPVFTLSTFEKTPVILNQRSTLLPYDPS